MEYSGTAQLAKILLLLVLLAICSATDLRARRVPNSVLAAALAAGLIMSGLAGGLPGILGSLGGLIIGLLFLMPFYLLRGMGAGDVKLLGVVGSILGAPGAVVAGLATMMVGAVLGVAYVAWVAIRPSLMSRMMWLSGTVSNPTRATETARRPVNTRAAEIPYAIAITGGTLVALFYLNYLSGVIRT